MHGVVYSQAQRYAKRNNTLEDFRVAVLRMVGRMASMGYVHRKINKQFGKFASRYTGRYGSHGVKKVAGLVVCRMSITCIEGRGGFEPFVDEGNDRVAILGSLRASLGLGYIHMKFGGASSGCGQDSWADASPRVV